MVFTPGLFHGPLCLSIYSTDRPSVCPSIHPSIHPTNCPLMCPQNGIKTLNFVFIFRLKRVAMSTKVYSFSIQWPYSYRYILLRSPPPADNRHPVQLLPVIAPVTCAINDLGNLGLLLFVKHIYAGLSYDLLPVGHLVIDFAIHIRRYTKLPWIS